MVDEKDGVALLLTHDIVTRGTLKAKLLSIVVSSVLHLVGQITMDGPEVGSQLVGSLIEGVADVAAEDTIHDLS